MAPQVAQGVQHTRELERVLRLPRRTWDEQETAFAERLSLSLRKPGGRMTLRPIQAQALYEAWMVGGLFGPIRVGGGKTLISLLTPFVMRSRRPLLITRANLVEKTKAEGRTLSIHWPIPNFIRIESYEKLGRTAHADLLKLYQPDLIIADEAHRLKNPKAAVTRRVSRHMNEHPLTRFVAISGTMTRKSILEYAHLLKWCLKGKNLPLPDSYSELEEWSLALDDTQEAGLDPGALVLLASQEERLSDGDLRVVARKAYRRRLVETPGVVATTEGHLGASLTIQAVSTDMSNATDTAFQELRQDWKTPDGWRVMEPMQQAQVARQLACGFYYAWDPRPPREWMEARKEWGQWCRYILTNNKRALDSELQVRNAIDSGLYPEAREALENWRRIEPTFTPNTVPVWLDDSVLDMAARWAMTGPGIVWCEHVAFAEKLARITKLEYYGRGGLNSRGQFIEQHPKGTSLIASEASNAEGRNLQYLFSRNLIVSPSANAQRWEQLMGRTHRDGQPADEVVFDVACQSVEHANALDKARTQARYVEAMTGQSQKILYADIVYPTPEDVARNLGPRWSK